MVGLARRRPDRHDPHGVGHPGRERRGGGRCRRRRRGGGGRPNPTAHGGVDVAAARVDGDRPGGVGARHRSEPAVRGGFVGAAARRVAPADGAHRVGVGRQGGRRRAARASAADDATWDRPHHRTARPGARARVPPFGRRARARPRAHRPAGADRGQPRQRVRRSDRGRRGAGHAARAFSPRRRCGRSPSHARSWRWPGCCPCTGRPMATGRATTGRSSRRANSTSPAGRWWRSSPRARPAIAPGSTGCVRGRHGSRSVPCHRPPIW